MVWHKEYTAALLLVCFSFYGIVFFVPRLISFTEAAETGRYIRGQVVDQNNQPQKSISVSVTSVNPKPPHYSDGKIFKNTATSANGEYEVEVPAGKFTFWVSIWPAISRDRYLTIDDDGFSYAREQILTFSATEVGTKEANFKLYTADNETSVHGYVDPLAILSGSIVLTFQNKTHNLTKQVTLSTGGEFSVPLIAGEYTVVKPSTDSHGFPITIPWNHFTLSPKQNYDLGIISPIFWDIETEPVVLHSEKFAVRFAELQANKTTEKNSSINPIFRFAEDFNDQDGIDPTASSGGYVDAGKLKLDPAAVVTSNFIEQPGSGMSAVTLIDDWTPAIERDRVHYEISINGTDWTTVIPGQAKDIAGTTARFKWRATLVSGSNPVTLDRIRIFFQSKIPSLGKPKFDYIINQSTSNTLRATIYGHNLGDRPRVWFGPQEATCQIRLPRKIVRCSRPRISKEESLIDTTWLMNERWQAGQVTAWP